ncbi:MAG: glycosyltransferase [Planctomycetes bacterium]|nr:glycosyltransferase [Planctomycetota bacterium]
MSEPRSATPAALRVLHLFANYKWTGPADPAIRSAAWLRRLGLDVVFAQAGFVHRGGVHRMALELWNARLPVVAGLALRKHFHPATVLRDARRLRALLQRERFDVVHTHLLGDHLTAALAVGPRRTGRPLLVRSLYDPEPPRSDWRARLAFARTDGVVAPSARCGHGVAQRFGRGGLPRVLVQEPPTERERPARGQDLRRELGLTATDFVVGITARVQPHRRFELLWEVAARVVAERPRTRFVLLGRGNRRDVERLVLEPVAARGLATAVVLPGYLMEPDYSRALRSLDAFLFLVPGSDGTCRAVREVMALGVPVVTTRRGMLPDLVAPHPQLADLGPAGLACEERAETLAEALIALCDDAELRARLGRAAAARAAGPMDPERAARRLAAFYAELRATDASEVAP